MDRGRAEPRRLSARTRALKGQLQSPVVANRARPRASAAPRRAAGVAPRGRWGKERAGRRGRFQRERGRGRGEEQMGGKG